jgi:coniferyl-aldehyde dehydrogenase
LRSASSGVTIPPMTAAATPREPAAAPAKSPAPSDMKATLKRMQAAQRANRPPTCEARIAMLERLEQTLLRRKDAVCDAISKDFGNRSRHESLVAEVFVTVQAIKHVKANLRDWMEPEPREVGWAFMPASAEIQYQPLGVVGIISPWNYPVQLAFSPLVNIIAAGNRAMIKPSELVPHTAELIAQICAEAFDPDQVAVFTGGPEVGEAFSKLPFDHLVFTGSTRVGRAVMRAAAENLTPVTLELGGKSPTIVGEDFAADVAASRIMGGKLFNSGQTCIAPDYVLLPESRRDSFVAAAKAAVERMYPTLASNADYTSIVSDKHYARVKSYVEDAEKKGAKVVEINPAKETLTADSKKIAPTLVLDPTDDMLVMQEEIFGPVLPIVTYKSLAEAIDYVNDHPRPLALYYFGYDRSKIDRVLEETVSGGVSINETMLHVAQDDLPFGGVGPSGMGHYHAFEGFETFSKKKAIFRQARLNTTGLLRPPFGKAVNTFLRVVLGK